MKPLRVGKYKEKYYTPGQSIQQSDRERRHIAEKLAESHKDVKPIKYLLKRK